MGAEQLKHDRVNLVRLVRRLEKAVSQDWTCDEKQRTALWIKAGGINEKLKYARSLLRNVEEDEGLDMTKRSFLQSIESNIDRLQQAITDVYLRLEPPPPPPTSFLSTLPKPQPPPTPPATTPSSPTPPKAKLEPETLPEEPDPIAPTLLLEPPSESLLLPPGNPSSTLLPPSRTSDPTTSTTTPAAPTFLTTSLQTQEDLSLQLAQMATQLKRNAIHFSESLSKDKGIVDEAAEKLEANFVRMKEERLRLRDHRAKSGGTTCMVMGAVIAVIIAWILTFLVIRIT
ncbi:hypothetical protein BOTBODRAFT_50297 [Botryobasidium botryosum FD-172 SS1]|uniref:Uncharacterized protein n=1 Tax=Botryobasidium botryosum (strain FD-172 SS1) TaxID=930990 RepID=A0A067N140_BOTB1|nr:hypothetical protein BOTBODRAFT_50297 [Botryobasidium botryosum FD-172 SS1]